MAGAALASDYRNAPATVRVFWVAFGVLTGVTAGALSTYAGEDWASAPQDVVLITVILLLVVLPLVQLAACVVAALVVGLAPRRFFEPNRWRRLLTVLKITAGTLVGVLLGYGIMWVLYVTLLQ
jgi:hypothetical protein